MLTRNAGATPASVLCLALTAIFLFGAQRAFAEETPAESPNDQARFIAGLPVSSGSPLEALQQKPLFKSHVTELAAEWSLLEKKRLASMTKWSEAEIRPKAGDSNVFYFFAGPDFISTSIVYPNAPTYLLCGLEPVGELPKLSTMKPESLNKALKNIRYTLRTTVKSSFFRTNEMSGDLTRTEFRGVVPLLYLFVARSNAQVIETRFVKVDANGAIQARASTDHGADGVPGVHIKFQREGHQKTQDLYYFRVDLENDALAGKPGFLTFWKSFAPGNSFLKAASFILHDGKHFSTTRDFILENSNTILQDDSGVPYSNIPAADWDFAYYGIYKRPLKPFHRHYQNGLIEAFKKESPKPLPFTTGYRSAGDANLVFAFRKTNLPAGK